MSRHPYSTKQGADEPRPSVSVSWFEGFPLTVIFCALSTLFWAAKIFGAFQLFTNY